MALAVNRRNLASSREGLISDRIEFETDCPHNHHRTVAFTKEDFEKALESGTTLYAGREETTAIAPPTLGIT